MVKRGTIKRIQRNKGYRSLGLKEHPFLTSADPRFLYLSGQHETVMDHTQRVIEEHQGLGVVEGQPGVGKSTLARRLYDIYTEYEDCSVTYLHTATFKTSFDLLQEITLNLGVKQRRSETALRHEFENWLIDQHAAQVTTIVIVDDAQMLEPAALEAVQAIYNFDVREKLVQVIMFGQSELRSKLAAAPALLSRVAVWQSILSLSPLDALKMINFRCNVAGRSESLLEASAFDELYAATIGLPRDIVIVCAEILSILERERRQTADLEIVREAVAAYRRRPEYEPTTPSLFELPETVRQAADRRKKR